MNIGFEGERTSIISDNWKSALDHPEVITEYLANEVAAGCKAGPFTQPPFSDFVGLPMGIVSNKCSFPVKYRIIHDLYWPPQDSVNNHIDPNAFSCFYGSFDDVVALIAKHWWALCLPNCTWLMPSSTSLLEVKIGPPWAHLGTSSGQMYLWSASTM